MSHALYSIMKRYKRIDTTTLKGLKQAERMHLSGKWKQIQVTPFSILFESIE